jgi:regulatory associated protein of mTOR
VGRGLETSSNKDYIASDVMDALMEEDMERLRARRRTASHPRRHHGVGGGSLSSPSNSTFSMDSTTRTVILGLGTGVGIRDVLPLTRKSSFPDLLAKSRRGSEYAYYILPGLFIRY